MKSRERKINIGIMSWEDFKQYTLSIAAGKRKPKAHTPKIWFHSMKSLAQVLSEPNQALLRLIIDEKPQSISELMPLTGRKANNLLRTLRTMENYGLVELVKSHEKHSGRPKLIPKVRYDSANIELHFGSAH